MKEAILKAQKNGLDLKKILNINGAVEEVKFYNTYYLKIIPYAGCSSEINFYHLIFGTDFVDRLVGEVKVCKVCGEHIRETVDRYRYCPFNHSQPYSEISKADYHLQQMARPEISRDIEKLKEYIRTLV